MKRATPGTFRFVWGVPVLLAMLTIAGLLAALLGTGALHILAWLAIAVPVIVGIACAFRRG